MEIAISRDLHPSDVVADRPHAVALIFERGNHHRQICFAARAGESRAHVGDLATGGFQAEDEHVFGHPALLAGHVAGDAQRETFFA